MKFSCLFIVMAAVILMAAESKASITSPEAGGSSVGLRILPGLFELNQTESSPVNFFESILPTASETTGRIGLISAHPPFPPPRSISCPPASPNAGATPPNCGKGNGGSGEHPS